ncbi:Adaptor protein complex AP-2 alpha subunit [Coemansia reversa NRRL 1564]|uniref:AP-2 complex subunit alpha n=1 Tax=Coemansia reversa (strain ATCC 12441 / NRRL 1564) TaxID=763665 RepID=A0A2G5B8V4_COERN|nr:Adaptor protein complex AP-2 alpha subunit [Coemansia reversa NRRL 1564]|eukprot:PIA15420.1 Adaptor protein complex AP-2 alpha subunit [Coemansia reversa NRRL 1564]
MAPMKGLTVFIADLRKCRSQEDEERRVNKELANIRTKFKENSLNGYNRKKYVCKLIYMSLLGHEVNIGHKEAVDLVNSTKFSEKQIGYLAASLLIPEGSELMRAVVSSLRRDLYDTNECIVCLALCAATNVATREIAESLTEDVVMLLLAPSGSPFVKKKAALCLLRLLRRFPESVKAQQWAARVIPYMGHRDVGVTLAVTSLVTALAQQQGDEMRKASTFAVRRLRSLVLDGERVADHVYYGVPAPWLQVKLLRLLQYFEPGEQRPELLGILRRIIDESQEAPRELQQMNAQYAVLFEAINLGIHVDVDQGLMHESALLLGRFITSRETNIRFLGLETMAHLAACIDSLEPIKRYQGVIVQSLRDRDVSVRRRALDLLYSMCDVTSAKAIVAELLRHMAIADATLREEMALKVAILTEKFATEYAWYVDVMMRLVSLAGDHMGDEVWHRIVQVILGNEELQLYACRIALQTLRAPVCHESALKVSAYVLGEFGHLIANAPGCAPLDQLKALQARLPAASLPARAVALTAVAKFTNLFPEIKNLCLRLLDRFRGALDAELQQRACEYYALATVESESLLPTVFEEMPPYPERQSALMSRLLSRETDTEDQRTWVVGGRDINRSRSTRKPAEEDSSAVGGKQETIQPTATSATAVAVEAAAPTSLDEPPAQTPEEQERVAKSRKHYARLLWESDGILYDGAEVQVGMMAQYKPPAARIGLFLGNKSAAAICDISIQAESSDKSGDLVIQQATDQDAVPDSLMPLGQARVFFDVRCHRVFPTAPTLRISYTLAGAPTVLELQLPVTAAHFMDPVTISVADFFARWKQLGESSIGESQAVLKTPFLASDADAVQWLRNVAGGMGFALIQGADAVPDNIVAVGIATTEAAGRFGCLMRVEPKPSHSLTRITIRATNPTLAKAVATNISMIFDAR